MIVALLRTVVVDLERAEQAIVAADPAHRATSACCTRSRSCRSCTTRSTSSSGRRPANLKDIYVFLLFELVAANVEKDAAGVARLP